MKHFRENKVVNLPLEPKKFITLFSFLSGWSNFLRTNFSHYLTATDEYPIMFVIAALTNGISKFYGIAELANKESNRILEMKKIIQPYLLTFISLFIFQESVNARECYGKVIGGPFSGKENIKISKLAQGLPVGGEIETSDDGTLISAFKNRKDL